MNKRRPKTLNFKSYAIILFFIAIVMLIASKFVVEGVHNFYFDQINIESHRLAKSYMNNLKTAIEASDIVNGLLEENIISSGEYVATYQGPISNEVLAELAKEISVDEINFYDHNGTIQYSASGTDIGWKAFDGHPVYRLLNTKEKSYVEAIRKDSNSNRYYKYGYILTDQGVIQIAVLAERIHEFLGKFEMQLLLDEMKNDQYVDSACFIDNDFNVIAGCELSNFNSTHLTADAKQAIKEDKDYSEIIEIPGKKLFEVMLPVFIEGEKAGTLIVGHDMHNTEVLFNNLSKIGVATFAVIYILIFSLILINYKWNKRNIHYAYYDLITDLPNRRYFDEVINEEINKNKEDKKAIIHVDFKNYIHIDLTLGHNYSERLMKKLSKTLSDSHFRLFHTSVDKFTFYVNHYKNKSELIELCNEIMTVLKDNQIFAELGVLIGVVEINSHKDNADKLMKNASIATEHLAEYENSGYCFFDNAMEIRLQREEDIKNELLRACEDTEEGGLYLEYQPILDLKTNHIYGFEALARIESEVMGKISPAEFIPIAEKTQLIIPLGKQVMKKACQFLQQIEKKGFQNIKISVNISAIQLLQTDFLPELLGIIDETKANPSNLVLEITESVFLYNYEAVNYKLSRIKERGIHISLDDFGTGYSSFARESELNIDTLKIDKFFIDRLASLGKSHAITGDIISMAHRLGHMVIAEGVELEEQKEYLLEKGCDYIQGFLFSKPIKEASAMERLFKQELS